MEVIKDQQLWKIARRRAKFKSHLATYIIVNGFLWALWYITAGRYTGIENIFGAWPIWPTLGWGVGIAFDYAGAYHHTGGEDAVQKEYDKLTKERNKL